MKIPTILGLAMLITAVTLAIMIHNLNQAANAKRRVFLIPKNLQVANITGNQAVITWQTDLPTQTDIIYDNNFSLSHKLSDNRDQINPKPHLTHFVTLNNLQPNTKYFYKIKAEDFEFPDKPLEFTTGPNLPASQTADSDNTSWPPPIRGIILDGNLQIIDDALVTLKIPNAQDLVAFSSSSGNFIISLNNLRTADLKNKFSLKDKTDALLLISRANLDSKIDLKVPFDALALPPLTLGQNLDLRDFIPSPSPKPAFPQNQFDLNSDGKVNSLDLSLVLQNVNKKVSDKKTDLNKDGVVDQKDVDLIKDTLK